MNKHPVQITVAALLVTTAATALGCAGDPAAPEGELPAEQVRALLSAFSEMGVWAAPGDFGPDTGFASFDCTGGGMVAVSGEAVVADSFSVAVSFILAPDGCGLAGGGLAFTISGRASGEGTNLLVAPTGPDEPGEVRGTHRIEGEFSWSFEERLGACVVLLDITTLGTLDGGSQAESVDGTLCGHPVGNFP